MLHSLAIPAVLLFSVACKPTGSDDTGGPSDPFVLPEDGAQFTYLLTPYGDDPYEVTAEYGETAEIAGGTWSKLALLNGSDTAPRGFISYTRVEGTRLEFIRADVWQFGTDPAVPDFYYELEAPIGGDMDAPEGSSETVSGQGTLCFGDSCDAYSIESTFTVLSWSESVQVPYGTVEGCRHISLSTTASDLGGFTLESEWWAASGIGMVKATEPPGLASMELVSFTP